MAVIDIERSAEPIVLTPVDREIWFVCTSQHIALGIPGDEDNCPFARAIRSARPDALAVRVGSWSVMIDDMRYTLTQRGWEFVYDFDRYGGAKFENVDCIPKPGVFKLTLCAAQDEAQQQQEFKVAVEMFSRMRFNQDL